MSGPCIGAMQNPCEPTSSLWLQDLELRGCQFCPNGCSSPEGSVIQPPGGILVAEAGGS